MKRSGFKRPERPARLTDPGRITRGFTYSGGLGLAAPKKPADRSQRLRDLARGEECQGKRYAGYCRCHPDTVVWAHANELGENKGMGYKANDSSGAFLGAECHAYIDQPNDATYEERMAVFRAAQERTTQRLREIASSPTVKPWRRETARWALERRHA